MKQLKVKTLGPYSLRTKEKPVTWKQAELDSPTSDLDRLINTLGPFLLTSKFLQVNSIIEIQIGH